jgi:hypothetical protein
VDGYEQLRQRVLAGDVNGWRMGLAVLQHRGVAAWLRVRQGIRCVDAPPTPAAATPTVAAGIANQLVAMLAGMALGAAAVRG